MSDSQSAPSTFGELHDEILRHYERELRPQGAVENHLVQFIARESHFLRVIDKAIDLCLSNRAAHAGRLSSLLRYKSGCGRRFSRALTELLRSRKQRLEALTTTPGSRPSRRAPAAGLHPFLPGR